MEDNIIDLLVRLVEAVEHMAYGDEGPEPEVREGQSLSDVG